MLDLSDLVEILNVLDISPMAGILNMSYSFGMLDTTFISDMSDFLDMLSV
jgi:hypothetical protein